MKCLNCSYKLACLQCSFTDKEVAEYIQYKKRESPQLPKKYAVKKVGKQPDGTWVFSSIAHLSSAGKQIKIEDSCYIWIGHVFAGHDVASDGDQCSIELPLTTDPLCSLLTTLRDNFEHNFIPCVMTMAAGILNLHYQTMLKKWKNCPIPLVFGASGTGKTTALLCALALYGAQETHFYSKITKEKVLQICANTGIPVGVDDPQSRNEISRLMIDFYQGFMNSTVSRGAKKPSTTCMISANFTTLEQQRYVFPSCRFVGIQCHSPSLHRYASRCIMIEFASPPVSLTLTGYMELAEKWEACSPCAGFCISVGERFFQSGYKEVDSKVLPTLESNSTGVTPRVLPAYSILYWFSLEVCIYACFNWSQQTM